LNVFPYWLLFSIFAAGALNYRRRAPVGMQAAPFLLLAALLIAAMIGLRYETGADWESYTEIFEYTGFLDLREALSLGDPGYSLLNWLAHAFELDLWFVNLACGVIFTWGLIAFAKRQPNPWLVIVIAVPYLVIVVAMGYSRQGVAIGLMMAALAALDRMALGRFVVYVVLAAAFHKTAVMVLPLVALSASKHRAVTGSILFAGIVMLYFFFLDAGVERLLSIYVDAAYESQGAEIRVAMNTIPAIIFLYFQKRFDLTEGQRKLWRNFSYAALALAPLLIIVPSSTAIDRLGLYLIPLQLFVLSRLPEAFPEKSKANAQIAMGVILYSALIQFVWLTFATHAEYWLPYQVYPLLESDRYLY
jgi:hypothetical protein